MGRTTSSEALQVPLLKVEPFATLRASRIPAFPRKYQAGMKKDDYWAYALEDCLDVVAT